MRRLLVLAVLIGLAFSFGCKEDKVIPPKDVPPPPKGPPAGDKRGGNPDVPKSVAPSVAP
jgi:hypothetical protein